MACLILSRCFGQGQPQEGSSADTQSLAIVQLLNQTINWYRQSSVEQQIATEPSDLAFLNDNHKIATQVVQQAFEFARQQEAGMQAKGQQQGQSAQASQYQALFQSAAKTDDQLKQTEAEVASLKQQLETTPARKRREVESALAEVESEVSLLQARRDALHTMVDFVSGTSANGLGASGLRAQIESLARSVPSALSEASKNAQSDPVPLQTASTAVSTEKSEPSGIWGLTSETIRLARKRRVIKQRIQATNDLNDLSKRLRAPLVNSLKDFIQQGDQITKEESTDRTVLAQQKQKLDELTAKFKQVTTALLPLSKQAILLSAYQRSLNSWQENVRNEYETVLKSLLLRLVVLIGIISVVIGLSEMWRRAIFRYVHDTRRRYQFLLLRTIVFWISIAIIVAVTFASALGSVATFAGLLTAGVAVALQNVILSIVGYFFLIGKYGIRVGDRVQLSGVTGEVVEVGLVRLHLMELGSNGADLEPTGRVVAFSNSIVFQPTSGLFKQIPGTNFVWHELTLTLTPDSDYRLVQERVVKAVDDVFAQYREDMERQRRQMERTLNSVSAAELRPRSHVRFTTAGIEVLIRFPVELEKAREIDDKVMRELLMALQREPRLKLVGSGISLSSDAPTAPA